MYCSIKEKEIMNYTILISIKNEIKEDFTFENKWKAHRKVTELIKKYSLYLHQGTFQDVYNKVELITNFR